jgi:hypothetical protein
MSTPTPSVEAKLAEAGLTVSAETLEALKTAAVDLESAAQALRGPRSYLQEPIHALRLWTK